MLKESVDVDILIVGAGIMGLMTAYQLKKNSQYKDKIIAVVDQAPYVGDHTSGRNSGVLHAGLYYETGSLKHLSCLKGNKDWRQIAEELSIPLLACGKYVFASRAEEVEDLEMLFEKSKVNQVSGIRWVDTNTVSVLDTYTKHAGKAFFSENTGIIDASEALEKLKLFLEKEDCYILLNTEVQNINKNQNFEIECSNEIIHSEVLINCAGLGAVDLRKKLFLSDFENRFVKGNYLKSTQKMDVNSLIYPVPPKDLAGLGVHLTLNFQGQILFGPNTEEVSSIDYQMGKNTKQQMLASVNRLFKNIDNEKLELDYCGVRPKILKEGQLYRDFVVQSPESLSGYVECLGIESPGFTAAPALAEKVIAKL